VFDIMVIIIFQIVFFVRNILKLHIFFIFLNYF